MHLGNYNHSPVDVDRRTQLIGKYLAKVIETNEKQTGSDKHCTTLRRREAVIKNRIMYWPKFVDLASVSLLVRVMVL